MTRRTKQNGTTRSPLPREIWVLVAAAVAIALGYGIVAPVIPRFARSFEVTNFAATAVVSAFAMMRLVFAPVSGMFSTRFGERRMFILGIYLVAISSFASGFAHSYWQLLIYRALGGVGSVIFSVAAMSLIIRWAPVDARGRASAAYGSGFLLGNIAGPAVGAILAPFGYRLPFLIYAGTLICAALIVTIFIPSDQRGKKVLRLDAHEGKLDVRSITSDSRTIDGTLETADIIRTREAFQNTRFRLVLTSAFAQGWTNMGVRMAVAPLLAATIIGAPTWLAGAMLASFAIGNGASLLTSGKWSDIYVRRRLILIGLSLSGLATIPMGFAESTWVLILLSLVGGYGAGLVQPSQQGAVADIIGKRKGGAVVSLFQQSADFGQILGPLVAGLIIDHGGFALTYFISGLMLWAAATFWFFFGRAT
ncbi:MAG: MFS transporter [Arcanobacterium sp.]|nr:MFS transporter [Arcanobacterium sp.]